MTDLKIFLAYHKDSPSYKSDYFCPIQVGAANSSEKLPYAIQDNNGVNISDLNPYYCELTGHYWVLNNYLNTCEEKYIGFAHYRRLPDLLNVSDKDIPAIYGIGYNSSLELFNKLNNSNLYNIIKDYDIICPCSCYMYASTVNPMLKKEETNYNVYNHFIKEHNNNLLEILKTVISHKYPDWMEALEKCYASEKSHFYNLYIMKTPVIKSFLEWQFDILDEIGKIIGGWEQPKYTRMAGFISETLFSIWLINNQNLKIGYTPIYMIDFEADYISQINELHEKEFFDQELEVLNKYLPIASDKFSVCTAKCEIHIKKDNIEGLTNEIQDSIKYAKTGEDFYRLAMLCSNVESLKKNTCEFFKKSLELNPEEKLFAESFLNYAKTLHDIEVTAQAWSLMKKFELTKEQIASYEHFEKVYNMLNNY